MEKVVIDFFKKHNLILKNKTIVIAVSTGVDSMALLTCFNNLKNEYNLNIHIAHVNHQIRKESIEEEEYIKEYAKSNELDLHIMHLEKSDNENFQSYAREKRYKFFSKTMEEVRGDYLLLAHHANDNLETIMMRILRGSSLKGYGGINEVVVASGYKILRPFLSILKDDLIKYVKTNQVKYYEDYSNLESFYTRNRIRKDLIPIIFKEDKNAHEKFQEFSNTINEAAKIVEEKVEEIIKAYDYGNNYISFGAFDFLKQSEFIREEIIFKLLKKYDLSKANIKEIIKIIESKKKNIKVEFKDSFTIVKEYEKITLLNYLINPFKVDIIINELKTYFINDTIEIIVTKKDSNFLPGGDMLWYNRNILPVRIRSRKPGDKILLESGYKKVKDLLIDFKLGILERDKILIMEKDEEILAVLGVRKSIKLKKIEDNDILIYVRSRKNG